MGCGRGKCPVEDQQVVVAQRIEGVPALEVAVAEVDEVVAGQAGDHQQHALTRPALTQHPRHVAQRPATGPGPHDSFDERDDGEEDQGLGQPAAEHLTLGVAHRDAEGCGPLGHHGRPEDDDDPEPPHEAVAALGSSGARRRRPSGGSACWGPSRSWWVSWKNARQSRLHGRRIPSRHQHRDIPFGVGSRPAPHPRPFMTRSGTRPGVVRRTLVTHHIVAAPRPGTSLSREGAPCSCLGNRRFRSGAAIP